VGFARALVVEPTLLLMDEPFSALDVLTAETLRTDLLDLWTEGKLPIKSVLIVTHNIEEAVFMCDRILVLSSNPGRVIAEITVPFRRPRNRLDPAFRKLVDDIYARMTERAASEAAKKGLELGSRLPRVSTNLMAGLIEMLAAAPYHGRADMPEIARSLHLEVDDLFPIVEVLQILGFAEVRQGDVFLTPQARVFAEFGTQERKTMFAQHLLEHVPLAARIRKVLDYGLSPIVQHFLPSVGQQVAQLLGDGLFLTLPQDTQPDDGKADQRQHERKDHAVLEYLVGQVAEVKGHAQAAEYGESPARKDRTGGNEQQVDAQVAELAPFAVGIHRRQAAPERH
jgi:hypothetical protein